MAGLLFHRVVHVLPQGPYEAGGGGETHYDVHNAGLAGNDVVVFHWAGKLVPKCNGQAAGPVVTRRLSFADGADFGLNLDDKAFIFSLIGPGVTAGPAEAAAGRHHLQVGRKS